MYHVIGTAPASAAYPGLWVTADAFRLQVDALARRASPRSTLDTVLDAWAGRARLPTRPVVAQLRRRLPAARGRWPRPCSPARRWPGVLNLVVAQPRRAGGRPRDGCSRHDLRRLGDRRPHAHPPRPDDPGRAPRCGASVAGSRAAIRRRLRRAGRRLLLPAGRCDATVEEAAVRTAGYRAATTERPGRGARRRDDRLALPRLRVDAAATAADDGPAPACGPR